MVPFDCRTHSIVLHTKGVRTLGATAASSADRPGGGRATHSRMSSSSSPVKSSTVTSAIAMSNGVWEMYWQSRSAAHHCPDRCKLPSETCITDSPSTVKHVLNAFHSMSRSL